MDVAFLAGVAHCLFESIVLAFFYCCKFVCFQANAKGIAGNFRGDGMLNGGMLIVSKGGEKVLLSHKQDSPGDHVSNEKILEVLGITAETKKEDSEAEGGAAQVAS